MATQAAIRKLDKVFSEYVRRRHANFSDLVECFTCSRLDKWQNMDAGHFMPRACMSTRFDMKNVQPQCRTCNRHKNGMRDEFARNLDAVFGMGTAEHLRIRSKRMAIWTDLHIQTKIEIYQTRLKQL